MVKNKINEENIEKYVSLFVAGGLAIGTTAFLFSRYKTSRSNEWLVRTGLFVNDMQIGKKFFKFPFQNIQKIDVTPISYNLNINSMSKEKMEFKFPIVFTIGPKADIESLSKYARYLLNLEDKEVIIKSIIEGESRSLSANISIEDIFTGRNEFKNNIIQHIQPQLDQYGITIYNANIEELRDSESSNYFKSLSLRIKSEAENKAKVQVAEQNKIGEIGAKERQSETRQRVAIVESEAIIVENERQQAMLKSAAELEKLKAEQDLIMKSAQIKSQNEAEKFKMDLEKEVQAKRLQMEVEKVRAAELSKVQVNAEKAQKEAEGLANAQKLKADADLYTKTKDAEAILNTIRLKAEADLYTKIKEADAIKIKAEADLIAKENEAKGLNAIYNAQSDGINKLATSFNGDTKALISYMMLEKDQFTKLAESSAKAIHGLNPKITIWNTDGKNPYDGITKLGQTIVPLIDTIKEQSGYQLPDWIIKEKEKEKEMK